MKIEKLSPGMVVYDVHSYRMGNTTMRSMGVWRVRIASVDLDKQTCIASWNGNEPKKFWHRDISKWRKEEPVMITGAFGKQRLATREEKKALIQPK